MVSVKYSIRLLKKLNYKGKVLENINLSKYCTFKTGGNAKVLLEICTLENFLHVLRYIEKKNLEYFVLGAGSNLLISDKGYNGIIIKLGGDLSRIEYNQGLLECGAGVKLASIYNTARDLGLSGLEDSAGIPATLGGAVYMNASAYNFQMCKIIEYVVAYVDGKITYYKNEDCKFSYRSSVFQNSNAIILRVALKLEPKSKQEIQERFKEILDKRSKSQPIEYPSAGCVFKRKYDLNISKMLDDCGLKGLTFGDAKVSEKHANFIINMGDASSQDIYYLIGLIKKRFKDKTGIVLDTEIKLLGEFDENTW